MRYKKIIIISLFSIMFLLSIVCYIHNDNRSKQNELKAVEAHKELIKMNKNG